MELENTQALPQTYIQNMKKISFLQLTNCRQTYGTDRNRYITRIDTPQQQQSNHPSPARVLPNLKGHQEPTETRIVSEYDQEIPQSQTADNPTAPQGRTTQPSQHTRKTN